ncbi:MAG: hypothetical protein IKQ55_08525 [Kiritimatiellae bacterium]|nr:hypothetical protein [Kiritimatiellia bacterium]
MFDVNQFVAPFSRRGPEPPEKPPGRRGRNQDARVLANPAARRGTVGFPMIGKYFSNGWKNFDVFSNDWKNLPHIFQ